MNAADFTFTFTFTHQPAAQIPEKGNSTFQVLFTPKAQGLRQATVTVLSDCPDEGTYTFGVYMLS